MTSELPDYDTIADDWDRREQLQRPVAEAIADRLPAAADGALLLDLGCGTGEPGFTVKARRPSLRLLGIDSSEAMVELARTKARRLGIEDASFEVRTMSDVGVGTGSVDLIVSRYSLLVQDFQDPRSSVVEAARVLRPGGGFAFAAWDRAELNPLIAIFFTVLSDLPGDGVLPNPFALDGLAAPGYRAGLLREAGFEAVEEAAFTWDYRVSDREALMEILRTSPYGPFLTTLDAAGRSQAEEQVAARAGDYRAQSGDYRFPTACRLFWGRR
jgi:trans-aconitate 2-methyltransferase